MLRSMDLRLLCMDRDFVEHTTSLSSHIELQFSLVTSPFARLNPPRCCH